MPASIQLYYMRRGMFVRPHLLPRGCGSSADSIPASKATDGRSSVYTDFYALIHLDQHKLLASGQRRDMESRRLSISISLLLLARILSLKNTECTTLKRREMLMKYGGCPFPEETNRVFLVTAERNSTPD
jgi:hypothetical protein